MDSVFQPDPTNISLIQAAGSPGRKTGGASGKPRRVIGTSLNIAGGPLPSTQSNQVQYNSYFPSQSSTNAEHSVSLTLGDIGSPVNLACIKKLGESRTVINRQASILDENRIVLYKKGKQMGKGYYIVEISSSHTKFYITAFNVEKPQSHILEIPEKRTKFVLEQFDHDFDLMANYLVVQQNRKLILLNPHYDHSIAMDVQFRMNLNRRNRYFSTMGNFNAPSDGDDNEASVGNMPP